MWNIVLLSMAAGFLFYSTFQFLVVGLKNQSHRELIIAGIISFFYGFIAIVELFVYKSKNIENYHNLMFICPFTIVQILILSYLEKVSGQRLAVLKWIYFILTVLNFFLLIQDRLNPVVPAILITSQLILYYFLLMMFRNKNEKFNYLSFWLIILSIAVFSDFLFFSNRITSPFGSFLITGLFFYQNSILFNSIAESLHLKNKISIGEQNLKRIIDIVPCLIFVKDFHGRFVLANKALADLYDVSPENMIGKTHEDFFHVKNEIEFFRQKDMEVIHSGTKLNIPKEIITDSKNNVKFLQTVKIPFKYAGCDAILGVSTEITEIMKSDAILKENQLLLETIFEDAPVPMVLINKKTELIKINKAGKSIGIIKEKEYLGLRVGNAFNCIVAAFNNKECGNNNECTSCRLRQTIQITFESKTNQNKVPLVMMVVRDLVEVSYNFLLSTSYIEINNSPMALMVFEDVTSIVKAEQALVDTEFRYKQITRAITDYIYTVIIHDNKEILTVHTPACFKITGYLAEEFELNPNLWLDIIFDEDKNEVLSFMKNIRNSKEKNVIEYRIVRKNGSVCWVSNTLVIKAHRKDKSAQYDGVIRDITERKIAEEALENQNKLFNTMLDNLPIGIFMVSAVDGRPLIANKHAKTLLGQGIATNAELKNLNSVYNAYLAGTEKLYPIEEMPISLGLQGIESHVDNMEVEHSDGNRVLLEIVGCPVFDTNNKIYASLVGFYDITERKNSEVALRESEKKLSIIFEYSHIGISLSDEKGNLQYMNPAFCRLLKYQPDQLVVDDFRLFTDTETALFEKLRKKETDNLNFEKKYINKDGREIWVQLQVSCFRNLKGKVTNFIAMAEDISERKKSIELLKASEEKFRNIFNTSNDAILITDIKGNILEVNQITLSHFGLNLEQLKKYPLTKLISSRDQEMAQYQFSNILKTNTGLLQTSYTKQNGEKIYIEIAGHEIKYNGKKAALLISRDISERMIMQQKILNAIIEAEEKERNFFSQELHDGIGPILSTVKLYLQQIQNPVTKSDKTELLEDALNTIEEAIFSIKEISNKLSPNVLKKFGLETAIQSFVKKISNLGRVQFSVKIKLPVRLRQEIETMLYRVFVEAINNSLKYAEASQIDIRILTDKHQLTAIFRDNGKGFETNQALENVTGNGLFNMQNRVQTYEGSFTVKSNPGKGTEIIIVLPSQKYLINK